jgi:hypothetical protein
MAPFLETVELEEMKMFETVNKDEQIHFVYSFFFPLGLINPWAAYLFWSSP